MQATQRQNNLRHHLDPLDKTASVSERAVPPHCEVCSPPVSSSFRSPFARREPQKYLFPSASDGVPIELLNVGARCPAHASPQSRASNQPFQVSQKLVFSSSQISGFSVEDGLWLIVLAPDNWKSASRCLQDYLGRTFPMRRKQENVGRAILLAYGGNIQATREPNIQELFPLDTILEFRGHETIAHNHELCV